MASLSWRGVCEVITKGHEAPVTIGRRARRRVDAREHVTQARHHKPSSAQRRQHLQRASAESGAIRAGCRLDEGAHPVATCRAGLRKLTNGVKAIAS
eukprot:359594-Chlamydomonas_euryale.AAC.2